MKLHYGEKYTDQEYNEILLAGCMEGGIAAFTGDGSDARVMQEATAAVQKLRSGNPDCKTVGYGYDS